MKDLSPYVVELRPKAGNREAPPHIWVITCSTREHSGAGHGKISGRNLHRDRDGSARLSRLRPTDAEDPAESRHIEEMGLDRILSLN